MDRYSNILVAFPLRTGLVPALVEEVGMVLRIRILLVVVVAAAEVVVVVVGDVDNTVALQLPFARPGK